MRNVSDETPEIYFMFESCFFFFFENRAVYEIISKKSGTAGQAIDKNIIWRKRYSCWITKAADKHALRICNKYCFSTTMIARTRLNMSLYLHCLSFVNIVPQHSSCRGNFISHETCIRFQLGILHPLQFTLLHFTENFQSAVLELLSGSGTRRKFSKCSPRASKRIRHPKKIFKVQSSSF